MAHYICKSISHVCHLCSAVAYFFIFLIITVLFFCLIYHSFDSFISQRPFLLNSASSKNPGSITILIDFFPTDNSLICSLCYQGITVIFTSKYDCNPFPQGYVVSRYDLLFPDSFSSEFSTSSDLIFVVMGSFLNFEPAF